MQTVIDVDDELVAGLRDDLGIESTSVLVTRALVEMRQRLAGERLIAMGGSDPTAKAAPRRRPPYFLNPD